MSEQEKILKGIIEKIIKAVQPKKIILFGSYASGTPTSHSDMDILIVKSTKKLRWERELFLSKILYPPPLPIDHIWRTPRELEQRMKRGDLFYKEILERGKVVYEA